VPGRGSVLQGRNSGLGHPFGGLRSCAQAGSLRATVAEATASASATHRPGQLRARREAGHSITPESGQRSVMI